MSWTFDTLNRILDIPSKIASLIAGIFPFFYLYEKLSAKKRKRFSKILKIVLEPILEELKNIKSYFSIYEGAISSWVISSFRGAPTDWVRYFSFKQCPKTLIARCNHEAPMYKHKECVNKVCMDYNILFQDLKKRFPDLVSELEKFERDVKEIYPQYEKKLFELTKAVLSELQHITDADARARSTEVVVMSLAGYDEGYYPNDKRFLDERGFTRLVSETIRKVRERYGELVEQFVKIRREGIDRIEEVEKHMEHVMYEIRRKLL